MLLRKLLFNKIVRASAYPRPYKILFNFPEVFPTRHKAPEPVFRFAEISR